jgi:hypothetical protein
MPWISCPARECFAWEDHPEHQCGRGHCAKWIPTPEPELGEVQDDDEQDPAPSPGKEDKP